MAPGVQTWQILLENITVFGSYNCSLQLGVVSIQGVLVCSWMASGRSLINITKRSGLTRLPWGTPEVTGKRAEASPSITTLCVTKKSTHFFEINKPDGAKDK